MQLHQTLQTWAAAYETHFLILGCFLIAYLFIRRAYISSLRISTEITSLKDAIEQAEECGNNAGDPRLYVFFSWHLHQRQTVAVLNGLAREIVNKIRSDDDFFIDKSVRDSITDSLNELRVVTKNNANYHKVFAEWFQNQFVYQIGRFVGSKEYTHALNKITKGYQGEMGSPYERTNYAYHTLVFLNTLAPFITVPIFSQLIDIAANQKNKYAVQLFYKENEGQAITLRQWKQLCESVLVEKGEVWGTLFKHLQQIEEAHLDSVTEAIPDAITVLRAA